MGELLGSCWLAQLQQGAVFSHITIPPALPFNVLIPNIKHGRGCAQLAKAVKGIDMQ